MTYQTVQETVESEILLYKAPKLEKLINRLNKKLDKRDLPNIMIRYGDKGTRSIESDVTGHTVELDTVGIAITGYSPSINGYELLGIKTDRDGLPLYIGNIPKEYQSLDQPHCDHCNTKRKRKTYAVIRKSDTKDILVIGKTCFADFFGGTTSADLLSWANSFKFIEDELSSDDSGKNTSIAVFDPVRFLAVVANVMDEAGFITATKAEDEGLVPTWYRALRLYSKAELKAEDYECAKLVSDHINSLSDDESAYITNLKIRLGAPFVSDRDLPLVASATSVYERFLADKLKREAFEKRGEGSYIGNLKDRLNLDLELVGKQFYDNQYGGVIFYHFLTQDGNSIVWKASSSLGSGKNYELTEVCPEDGPYTHEVNYRAEIGDRLTVKATITKHDIYEGKYGKVKTTYINRVQPSSFIRNGLTHPLI